MLNIQLLCLLTSSYFYFCQPKCEFQLFLNNFIKTKITFQHWVATEASSCDHFFTEMMSLMVIYINRCVFFVSVTKPLLKFKSSAAAPSQSVAYVSQG